MHELSLAQALVDLVEEHARRDGFARARALRVALGALSHVAPEALAFGFEVASRGTRAEGARLVLERVAARGFCTRCAREVEIATDSVTCAACGEAASALVGGDELRLVDLEVV